MEAEAVTADSIMIPLDNYPHIPYWFTIRQAIAEIQHSVLEINGRKSLARAVLVFDEEYKLLGMVRRRDILCGLEPESFFAKHAHHSKQLFNVEFDPNLLEVARDHLSEQVVTQANKSVSEIMVPIGHTVDYSDHLVKIIYEMNINKYSMMPVMKDGVVVGVIRTVEVMNEIAKMLDIS
ncbi:MAG: CBS domain-containing protein [Candidatus Kapaibacterium sp.]